MYNKSLSNIMHIFTTINTRSNMQGYIPALILNDVILYNIVYALGANKRNLSDQFTGFLMLQL